MSNVLFVSTLTWTNLTVSKLDVLLLETVILHLFPLSRRVNLGIIASIPGVEQIMVFRIEVAETA